jgi:cytochrome c oxidase cbb3-type subunit 3
VVWLPCAPTTDSAIGIYFDSSACVTGGIIEQIRSLRTPAGRCSPRPGSDGELRSGKTARLAGEKIFRSHCASCHGLNGAGGSGPSLTSGIFYHGSTDADLYRNISEGIPGTAMPDQFFSSAQIWQIVAYVRSLSVVPVRPKLTGDAYKGAQLFREKGCSGCHLIKGEGGVRGPDLSVIGSQRSVGHLRESILDPGAKVEPAFWVAKIVAKDGERRTGFILNQDTYSVQLLDFSGGLQLIRRSDFKDFGIDRSSIMPSYKGKLSEAELDHLITLLASLERPREDRK